MSPRPCPIALALLGLLGLAVTVRGEEPGSEDVVEARLEWEPGRVGPYTAMFIPFRSEAPDGVPTPADVREARYARIRWGTGRGLALALDVAPGHERLWIDTDLDGAFDDEVRQAWAGGSVSCLREEEVAVACGEGEPPDRVGVRFQRAAGWDPDRVQITPWVHRRGHVVLAGRVRAVALVDDNADLRFDDVARTALYVDVDGDGDLDGGSDSHERIALGEPFRVGEEGWVAELPEPSGRRLRFRPASTVPPARPRTWPYANRATPGSPPTPPDASFEELAQRVRTETDLPYQDRWRTVSDLGRLGTEAAFDLLMDLARGDKDVSLQAAAARALGHPALASSKGRAVADLAASNNVPAAVSAAALQALFTMGWADRDKVYREQLDDAETVVVGAAARYLVQGGTEAGVRAVEDAWRRTADDNRRYQIYLALRSREDGPPGPVLAEAAASGHASMAARALEDLAVLDPPAARRAALAAAARRPVVEFVGKAVADVLTSAPDGDAVRALLAMTAEGSPALALHVAQALAPVRAPGAIDALLDTLGARAAGLRELAAQVLGGIPETRVTEALLQRLKRERDDVVKIALLEALGGHEDPGTVPALLKEARRRDTAIRQAAIRALARVGLHEPDVSKFFASLLDSRRWEDRVLALDAAGASGDRALCRKVLPSLDHEQRQVRQAAIDALERLRCPEAIPPLIDRLGVEEEARIVDALARALFRLTGINLYDDAALWRRWWEENGRGFVPPDEIPTLPAHDQGGTQAGFYGIPIRSGRVIFVIDQSGSMSAEDPRVAVTGAPSGNRLDVAVREVLKAVKGMRDRDFANVILFHTTVQPWHAGLVRLSSASRSELERHLLKQQPTGGTNLYDALEAALLDPEVDTVFLLSDGVPGSGRYVATEDILRAVRRLNQTRRTAIHGISIGRDSDLLRQLAEQNDGQYVRR